MANLIDEFKNLTETLNRTGIEYAVCGGWAMAIHGLPRATMDIDILILADDLERVWQLAKEMGYDVEGLPLHFDNGIIEIRRISKIDRESKQLITLDFLLVTDALLDVWAAREKVEWSSGATWTVSTDGLIKLKLLAGRKQDLLDIEKLREAQNGD